MSAFVLGREYELQLPNNYVEIDSDEMEYVDGGGVYNWIVAGAVNIVFAAAFGGGAITLVKSIIKSLGSTNVKQKIVGAITKYIAVQAANRIAGMVLGAIWGIASGSIGDFVANIWDANDTVRYNGVCNALW
ncbi:hypothetical protein [Clostridium isatidis]|uniref:Uncharacterized protein n=1 Tax=Clostridium isatidis TaxID=182773 RepID=A0A343J9L7_9CLOT|nr:hypothetical protein [Clostridium isatidis]ASW42225.1 hypothetical protein BEN51_01575 [Clostridium isatidis]